MTDCIEWTGARTSAGYGERTVGGEVRYTHRLAWEQAHGPIPDGLVVMHLCDNPACLNPDHLVLGTQRSNMVDMMLKGRGRGQFQPKTHCPHGHAYTPDNTKLNTRGHKQCRVCMRTWGRH